MQAGTRPSPQSPPVHDLIEFEQEQDGRWIVGLPSTPGAMAYGATRAEAKLKVMALRELIEWDRAGSFAAS